MCYTYKNAGMMELADVTDSKSVDGDIVWVRVPPPAPIEKDSAGCPFLLEALVLENTLHAASESQDETEKTPHEELGAKRRGQGY